MSSSSRLLMVVACLLSANVDAATSVNIPNGPNSATPADPLNEDKAKFNVSTFDDGTGRAFYFSSQNNRILVNYQNTDGSWRYNPSRIAIEIPETMTNPTVTIALGVVLAATTRDYKNPLDNQFYQRLMYFIYQGPSNTGAGAPCAAFSNDGLTWTSPAVRVGAAGAPVVACQDAGAPAMKLESISGARSGTAVWLAGLEGDLGLLGQFAQSQRTLTYLFSASPSTPHVLVKQGELPVTGMSTPTSPGGSHDYYFRNLDFSYDPVTDKAVILRATPYGYNVASDPNHHCLGVCPEGLATFPMRGQMYSQRVNGNPLGLLTGTWLLELDYGGGVGWPYLQPNLTCSFPIGTDGFTQTNIGIDLDSINIHKQMGGFVARDGSGFITLYMGGFQNRLGSCQSRPSAAATFLDGALYTATRPF